MLSDVAVPQALDFHEAGTLVLLDCVVPPPPGDPASVADVLAVTSKLQFRARLRTALRDAQLSVPILSMPAPQARRVSPFDFTQSAQLIREARHAGGAFLDSVVLSGPGLYGDPYSRYVSKIDRPAAQPSESPR